MMPAGIAFGLAVLSRSSAVLLSIPLGLAALRAGPARTIRLFAGTAAIGLAVLLPFVVADSSDVIHSLFTYRGGLVVGAGSVWSLTHGTLLEQVAQHWDIVAILAVVLASSLWLATRPGGLDQGRLFAGLTLASAGFAMLAKTVWPYYFFEPYVFGTVWAIGSWQPASGLIKLGLPALAFSVFGLVAEIGSDPILTPTQVQIEGAGMFAMLGLTAVWIAWNAAAHAAVQEAWK